MKKLYLIDVSSFFFRAFYAIPPLTNPDGMPTNALYGVMSMMMKLFRENQPEYVAVCYDTKEGSFRKQLFPEYKANRSEMPEDLVPQVPYLKKMIDALGITSFEIENYEADDVIGSLSHQALKENFEVIIVSGDKDFTQLITPQVQMYDTMKEVRYGPEGVLGKWGVRPDQIIDYLALIGDSSDNIPGVRGVGPKTAQKLLSEYGTLEGVYENLEKISGKSLKQKLEDHENEAYLSKELVTIVTSIDTVSNIEELQLKKMDPEPVKNLLEELGFKSYLHTLQGKLSEDSERTNLTDSLSGPVTEIQGTKKKKVSSSTKPKKVVSSGIIQASQIQQVELSLEAMAKEISPYSDLWVFAKDDNLFFGLDKKVFSITPSDFSEFAEKVSDKCLRWKGFDVKESWRLLGIRDQICSWDSMLASYVLKAGQSSDFEKVFTLHSEREISLKDLSIEETYAAQRELEEFLVKKLEALQSNEIYEKFELPLVPILTHMELNGIQLDKDVLKKQSQELEELLEKLTSDIHKAAGSEFNIGSPKQLSKVLFEDLGLTPGKKTKTGYSTNNEVLEKLEEDHEIVPKIMEYRELSKLKSTYVDALPELVNPKDERIHTHFRQAVTTTGRLSSQNPNLQNIPIRTERGRQIREAFQAKEGSLLLSADYSQIELRVLAHITEDPGLTRAFADNLDIHSATAAEIFGVSLEDVDSDLRRTAKAVNFGIAYGQGAYGLAETLGISRTESKDIIDKYFKRFSKVREYMTETVEQAKKNGYVETLFGRRRYIDELSSKNRALKAFGERAAINAPIQGTASDLMKLAMIEAFLNMQIPALLQVHDEILFECPESEVEDQSKRAKDLMENVAEFKVPLVVNIDSGKDWGSAH